MTCIVKYTPAEPLNRESFSLIVEKIKAALRGRVKEAYLFGSSSSGTFKEASDIDLILVGETDTPFPERGWKFADLYDLFPRIDILVYTPDELKQQLDSPSPGFWTSVKGSMKRIL